eukprot:5372755-Alexandrium_andersonii.AAC.1
MGSTGEHGKEDKGRGKGGEDCAALDALAGTWKLAEGDAKEALRNTLEAERDRIRESLPLGA